MQTLTQQCPKPLLKVGDQPLIEHKIYALKAAGFKHVVINTAYLGKQIRQTLGSGARFCIDITYAIEDPEPLGPAGGIRHALPHFNDAPFAVINADVWTDFPLTKLHDCQTETAHLILVDNPSHHPNGDFHFVANPETPADTLLTQGQLTTDNRQIRLTFSGIAVYHPRFFANCPPGRAELGAYLQQQIKAHVPIAASHFQGQWLNVDTPERLDQARQLYLTPPPKFGRLATK